MSKIIGNTYYFLICVISLLILSSCYDGSNGNNGNAAPTSKLELVGDDMAMVPILNEKPTQFYYYFTNHSTHALSNIKWSLTTTGSVANTSSSIQILDAHECTILEPNQYCRLKLIAYKPVTANLAAFSNSNKIILEGSSGIITTYATNTIDSGDLRDALTFSSIGSANLTTFGWNYDVFMQNNSETPIFLNLNHILTNLPAATNSVIATCPNPLPYGGICQIRLSSSSTQPLSFPLKPNAQIQVNDKLETLPSQHNMNILNVIHSTENANTKWQTKWSQAIATTANLKFVAPTISSQLSIQAPSLFNNNITLYQNTANSYLIKLTNTSSSNVTFTDLSLFLNLSSLLPAEDSYASYDIDTEGISNFPCDVKHINNGKFTLPPKSYCNYHLEITPTTITPSQGINKVINYSYQYFNPATREANTGSTASSSFNLNITSKTSDLTLGLAPGYNGQEFNQVPLGTTPSPSLQLFLQNNGEVPFSGNLRLKGLPIWMQANFESKCQNLAIDDYCLVTLTMNSDKITSSGNLNTAQLVYNNSLNDISIPLPNIPYQVVAPTAPAVTLTASVTGAKCYNGNGIGTATCYQNPDTSGGEASKLMVNLNFLNTSKNVTINNLQLLTSTEALFTAKNYVLANNTCTASIAPNKPCTISYQIAAITNNTPLQPNITTNNFGYQFSYANDQIATESTPLNISINVVNPSVVIANQTNALAAGSIAQSTFTATISNLYQNSVPSFQTTITDLNHNPLSSITATMNPCQLGDNAATCLINLQTNQPVVGKYNLNLTATPTIFNTSTQFDIINPIIFLTSNSYNGNLGGLNGADLKCTAAAQNSLIPKGLTESAILITPERTPCTDESCATQTNWPIKANTNYDNSVKQYLVGSNNYSILSSILNSRFYDESGNLQANTRFWLGIESIKLNSTVDDIDAWSYYNQSERVSRYWDAYKNNCYNYTSISNNAGQRYETTYIISFGETDVSPHYQGNPDFIGQLPPDIWGNWFVMESTVLGSLATTWNSAKFDPDNNNPCTQTMKVLCIAR